MQNVFIGGGGCERYATVETKVMTQKKNKKS